MKSNMKKILTVLAVLFGALLVAAPVHAGVITGDFVCSNGMSIQNVSEKNGVITGDADLNGNMLYDVMHCEGQDGEFTIDGAVISNGVITGDFYGVITGDFFGVITGD